MDLSELDNINASGGIGKRQAAITSMLEGLGLPNTEFMRDQLDVFLDALLIAADRNIKYKDLWKRRGWTVNLVHLDHKAGRLMKEFWGEEVSGTDPDLDSALDLINYTAFFIRNVRAGNRYGEQ